MRNPYPKLIKVFFKHPVENTESKWTLNRFKKGMTRQLEHSQYFENYEVLSGQLHKHVFISHKLSQYTHLNSTKFGNVFKKPFFPSSAVSD
jgi:hypothetical protein